MADQPPQPTLKSLLLMGVWFGITAGLLEGFGLLLFQRINWERWGPVLHITAPIVWISTAVDIVFFTLLVLLVAGIARIVPRMPAIRSAAFVLVTLTLFDWLILTERLKRSSCWLLAAGVAVAIGRWLTRHENEVLKFWKRSLPWLAATAGLIFVLIPFQSWMGERNQLSKLPTPKPGVPNILLIVVDTLRADHLSSYGYPHQTSPAIDRLVKEGVLFEKAVAASSWTFPSHVSLVTGSYMFEHGVGNVPRVPILGPDQNSLGGSPTIGETLLHAGYRTGAFSGNRTYFVGNLGFGRGFLHFEDYFQSLSDMLARTVCGRELRRVYLKRIDPRLLVQSPRYGNNYGVRKTGSEINREVLNWLGEDSSHPFFAFINYFDVHDPYGGDDAMPDKLWDVAKYDQGIQIVDRRIGELLQGLQERGQDKNTLVIVTSDHGESLGEHGMQGHGRTLYWNLIHVPLVVWYPGHVPAGTRIAQPVSNVALASTITKLIGVGSPATFLGPPLTQLWDDPQSAANWPEPLSELAQSGFLAREDPATDHMVPTWKMGPLRSLITPRWHLIVHKELGDQLYDWPSDPQETNNLIHTADGQEIARALVPRMNDVLAQSSERTTPSVFASDLPNGSFTVRGKDSKNSHHAPGLVDYYRVRANAGTKLTVQVRAKPATSGKDMDPMIAIEDDAGELYRTCRNPGDDRIASPGIADPTPEVADDICVNDDASPGNDTDSRLEMLVPGNKDGAPVELYLRVSDWNGNAPPGSEYQISVDGAAQNTHALGRQQ